MFSVMVIVSFVGCSLDRPQRLVPEGSASQLIEIVKFLTLQIGH